MLNSVTPSFAFKVPSRQQKSLNLSAVSSMSTLLKITGRLVYAILLAIFLYRVGFSIERYFETKIGTTTSREYSDWRLMPSVSVCFSKRNSSFESLFSGDVDRNLQQVKDEVLMRFWHRNFTEDGLVSWLLPVYFAQLCYNLYFHFSGSLSKLLITLQEKLQCIRVLTSHFSLCSALHMSPLGQPKHQSRG